MDVSNLHRNWPALGALHSEEEGIFLVYVRGVVITGAGCACKVRENNGRDFLWSKWTHDFVFCRCMHRLGFQEFHGGSGGRPRWRCLQIDKIKVVGQDGGF